MKLRNFVALLTIAFSILFTSCSKDNANRSNIIPNKFKVDIPNSISNASASGSRSASDESIEGEDIYEHMGTFIHIGEESAEIVQGIMSAIYRHNLSQATSFSYTSDEDGRTKDVVIVEGASFEGTDYEFQLSLSDALLSSTDDQGMAIQVFWNTSPVKGVAILKPTNINLNDSEALDAMFKIEYSEAGELGYDAHMIVSIADLPLPSALEEPYAMKNMKMFVGKKGDIIDVYGNSHHPNALFFNGDTGFNWAFVASGEENKDIAVAEVGLPSSDIESSEREVILNENSIHTLFTNQIMSTWPDLDSASVAVFLKDTEGPAYFDQYGFQSAGVSPGSQYDVLETNIELLVPYSPKDISTLSIDFK